MDKWLQGIAEIKEHVHDGSEEAKTDLVDITGKVLKLADSIWGHHDLSAEMGFVVHARPNLADQEFGRVLAIDNTLRNWAHSDSPLRGGYIHPETGLLLAQRPVLVFDWLDRGELPPQSPFAVERELLIELFTVGALRAGAREIQAIRKREQEYNSLTEPSS